MKKVNSCRKLTSTNAKWDMRHFLRLCGGSQVGQQRSCSRCFLKGLFLLFITVSTELNLVCGTLYSIFAEWMDEWMHKLLNLTPEQDKYNTGHNGIIPGYCVSYSGNVRRVSSYWIVRERKERPILDINHEGCLEFEQWDGWEGWSLWSRSCKLLFLKEPGRWCKMDKGGLV